MALRKLAGEVRPGWVIYTVYIDMVFAASTTMDMMVLTILNEVLLRRTIKRRVLTGAVIDGIRSCVMSLAPGVSAAVEILGTHVVVSSLMAVAAYHLESPKGMIRFVAGIYPASVVLEGVMLVLYEHTKAGYYAWPLVEARHGRRIPAVVWSSVIAGAAAVCYGFSGGIRELTRITVYRKNLCRVTMIYGEKKETVTGFMDTGNRLREPMNSQPAHVAAAGPMKQLCPTVRDVVYVPYQSVRTISGTLPAVFIDRMEIKQGGGRYSLKKPSIVITKQEFSLLGEYQILI